MLLFTASAVAQSKYNGVNEQVTVVAREVADLLREPATRNFVYSAIKSSRNRENIVVLHDVLRRASTEPSLKQQSKRFDGLLATVEKVRKELRSLGVSDDFASFDLYMPVKDHLSKWSGDDHLLVAAVPFGDESKLPSVTAFSVRDQKSIKLSQKDIPSIPTLVIVGEEHPSHERTHPPVTQRTEPSDDEPNGSEPTKRNSYIGIRWLKLINDHEPWTRGDPEIYVLVGQAIGGAAVESKIWLNSGSSDVNDENHWYLLGDSPSGILYFYFDETYSDQTYFRFMESDGGASLKINAGIQSKVGEQTVNVGLSYEVKDGDDELGVRIVNRNEVPWVGLKKFTTGDVEFKVDKDPS